MSLSDAVLALRMVKADLDETRLKCQSYQHSLSQKNAELEVVKDDLKDAQVWQGVLIFYRSDCVEN